MMQTWNSGSSESMQPTISPRGNPLIRSLTRTQLSPVRVQQLRKAFARYDVNGDGRIDLNEMEEMFNSFGITDVNSEERDEFVKQLDKDGDGCIGFDEFVRFYKNMEAIGANIANKAIAPTKSVPEPPNTSTNSVRDCSIDNESDVSEVYSSTNKSPRSTVVKMRGLLDLVRQGQREEERKNEGYITDKKRAARQRIYDLMYDLPSFAPDFVYRRWWDVVVLMIMLYHWVVALVQGIFGVAPTDEMLIVECIVSVLLILDIVMNLNTAIQAEDRSFVLIVDRAHIFKIYVSSGNFLIDLLAGLPFDILMWYASGLTAWRICRFFRALKVLKWTNLFGLTDRGNMDPAFVQFYFWTVPLLKLFSKMIFIGNSMTVGRMIIASWPDVSDSCDDRQFGLDACTESMFQRYLLSLWWCWALLTTQGLVKIENGWVYAYAGFVMLMSLLLQGHVVASMSALLLKSDIVEQNRDNMRSTLAIMRQYCIPSSLQQEVLSFQYHSLQQNAASGFAHILERLPGPMQKEVGLYVRVDLIAKVPMFEQLSTECKLELANCLDQTYCEPDCFIIEYGEKGDEMYFMMHGFADVIIPASPTEEETEQGLGKVITTVKRGDFFGEMALLNPELRRRASIQALTYCDMFQLHNVDFGKLLADFEELRDKVEAEAVRRGLNDKDKEDGHPSFESQDILYNSDNLLGARSSRTSVVLHPPTESEVKNLKQPQSSTNEEAFRVSSFHATRSFRKIQKLSGYAFATDPSGGKTNTKRVSIAAAANKGRDSYAEASSDGSSSSEGMAKENPPTAPHPVHRGSCCCDPTMRNKIESLSESNADIRQTLARLELSVGKLLQTREVCDSGVMSVGSSAFKSGF
eukprot:TRINITY_DN16025_c0_g1_i7.p1 TRINITY_DN16025_c0_g1~~TRINITY_DN16025_c0_g1_i7.p1  ORF type:complete len:861 (+),score=158.05 TRINITY_DN16025_c0_g1_i7:52-2634(+)